MKDKKNKNPKWLEQAIFYEIYPQSFRDTNADGIGDIKGITEKLCYIQELGCTDIWIHPCFVSPFDDAGYDVEDYYNVAPRYGTNADLVQLFHAAHEKGMHVLLDLVPGHTSYKHKWFQESMKPEKNEYTDRYVWTDHTWSFPEGFQCLRGISQRDGAAIVNFFSTQPALNYGFYKPDPNQKWQQSMEAPGPMATREEMKNIMRFWLDAGCDGFRIDLAASLVKNDFQSKGAIALWQDVRKFMDQEYPEAVMISEWGNPTLALEAGFHMDFVLQGGPSHYDDLFRGDKPYFTKKGDGSIKAFLASYKEYIASIKGKGYVCIPSGNHDVARISEKLDTEELKVAFAFLFSMPGVPFLYYGDEIGMRYLKGVPSKEGGFYRTGARTPMQWSSSINAGFSEASPDKLYLPIDCTPDRPNVESQWKDETSLLNEVRHLIHLRKENPALSNTADIEILMDDYPLVYKRSCPEQAVAVIVNPTVKPAKVSGICGKVLYSIGVVEQQEQDNSVWVDGCTVAFIAL